jgi:sec-independent protein translocase protein TatA
MFGLGAAELILILAIGLLLFGNRLPDVARSLGKTFTTFRKEIRDVSDDLDMRS